MRFLLGRLLSAIPVVFGVALMVFLLLHLVPGDPVELMLGDAARPADREALRHALGLDRPVSAQLLDWFYGLARLELGTSLFSRRPVTEELLEPVSRVAERRCAARWSESMAATMRVKRPSRVP